MIFFLTATQRSLFINIHAHKCVPICTLTSYIANIRWFYCDFQVDVYQFYGTKIILFNTQIQHQMSRLYCFLIRITRKNVFLGWLISEMVIDNTDTSKRRRTREKNWCHFFFQGIIKFKMQNNFTLNLIKQFLFETEYSQWCLWKQIKSLFRFRG